MKTLACLLIFVGMMYAQDKPAEPYRMNNDVLGESLEEFRHNNPKCTFQDSTDKWVKGVVRLVGCEPRMDGHAQREPDDNWEPDTNYDGVPLWTRKGIFHGKDGLVMLGFEFRSADAPRIEKQFLRDFGSPSQGLTWANGTSIIFLQAGSDCSDCGTPHSEFGVLLFMQETFFQQGMDAAKEKVKAQQ